MLLRRDPSTRIVTRWSCSIRRPYALVPQAEPAANGMHLDCILPAVRKESGRYTLGLTAHFMPLKRGQSIYPKTDSTV